MRFRFPWRTRAMLASELDEEIAYHIAARTAELEAQGLGAAEARQQAEAEFGDVATTRAYCLEQDRAGERTLRWSDRLDDLRHDLRLAARRLARQPMLLATAAGTLGLGIGAATALWTVVRQVVVNPFPFRGGDRIVTLWHELPQSQVRLTPQVSAADLWRAQSTTMEGFEPIAATRAVLLGDAGAEMVQARGISHSLLEFTGLRPALGRGFGAADRAAGAPRVAMLGFDYWRDRYGSDPDAVGRTVILDNERVEIVGVLPRELDRMPGSWRGGRTSFVLPLPDRPAPEANAFVLGRLRPGVSLEVARAEMRVLDTRLVPLNKVFQDYRTRIDAGRDVLGTRNVRTLYILLGAVGLLLVIACANVTHLLLGRMLSRRTEQAVRSALGASRASLVRSAVLDAGLIGLVGAVAGLLASIPLLKLIVANRPPGLDLLAAVKPDMWVAVVAGGLGMAVALLTGLLPAWRGSSAAPAELLHGSWAAGRPEARRLRELLLLTEVGLSLLLLVGAGLVTRSLWRLGALDIGFDPAGVVTAEVELPSWRFQNAESSEAFLAELADAVREIPGIQAVTRASGVPPETGISFGSLEIDGRVLAKDEQESFFAHQSVEPGYFAALSIPFRVGAAFPPRTTAAEPVVIISESLARRYWPDADAVGHRIRIGNAPWKEIVGVAADVPALGLGELRGALQFYSPMSGAAEETVIIARTTLPLPAFEAALRQVINRIDPAVPIRRTATVPAMLRASTATERFTGVLLAGFAAFATVLFAAGLFGVLSHAVSQRTREIGVRIAIGADPGRVRWLVIRQGLRPVLLGVVAGLIAAWMSARAVASLLFDITPRDTLTFAAAATITIVVALAASYFPARRASRLDPVTSLRE